MGRHILQWMDKLNQDIELRRDQNDRLYGGNEGVLVDADLQDEYDCMVG